MEGFAVQFDVTLEGLCPHCKGGAARPFKDCPVCLGVGSVPTAAGWELLDFMFKYAPIHRRQQKIRINASAKADATLPEKGA